MRFRLIPLLLAGVLLAGCEPKTPVGPEVTEPGVPQNVVLHGATDNSLTFQWSVVENASGYDWRLTSTGQEAREGSVAKRNVSIDKLTPGTTYLFSVRAVNSAGKSAYSSELEAKTTGTVPTPPGPGDETSAVCTDAPVVIKLDSAPVLGSSGLIRVLKADGIEVDRIDLADMATVDVLEDGTMIPKGANADAGKIAIGNDYVFNTFMDALHSNQYRAVHYTPLRIKGNTLEIKLHNEALAFGQSYTVKVDEAVLGRAVDDVMFTTKAKPSGSTVSVNADGSADFCTVQGALSFVSTNVGKDDAATIEVAAGTYRELLFMRGKNNVTIKGASRTGTVIAYPNNESYETGSGGSLSSKPSVGKAIGKSGGRSLFLVETCDNLVLENLTLENTYSIPSHKGQAETIYFNCDGKRLTVENCSLISYQDTFLCKGSVWVHNSLIAGHCDFIWGYPTACLFENCEIRARAAGYIVQARVQSASSVGFVFLNCSLTAEDGVKAGSMYLARSAGQADCYDNVVFANCTMGAVIASAGWYTSPAPNPSAPTATAGWREFGSVDGAGKPVTGHNAYGKVLSADEAAPYLSREAVLGW